MQITQKRPASVGPKAVENKYDPQVGAAANANARIAERAQAFSEKYYTEHVSPMLEQMIAQSKSGVEQSDKLFDINYAQAKMADDRFRSRGIAAEDAYYAENAKQQGIATEQYDKYVRPGQDRYFGDLETVREQGMKSYTEGAIPAAQALYKQARDFNTNDEFERQATQAVGDVKQATATASSDMGRRLSAMGVDPTSPAAIAAANSLGIQSAAAEASAANKARTAARSMGMALTTDAANFGRGDVQGITASSGLGAFTPRTNSIATGLAGDAVNLGRGGTSQALQFGQQAQGNATGAFGIAAGAVDSANSGASVPMAGYGIASGAYGTNLNAYTKLSGDYMSAQAQSNAGFSGALGSIAGVAGSAAIKYSDRRLKTDIVLLARLPSGIGLYAYRYLASAVRSIGVMADEVKATIPAAVSTGRGGYMMVDYSKVF